MEKDEIDLLSEKVASQAWDKLKIRGSVIAAAIVLVAAYFGWDWHSSRKTLQQDADQATKDKNEIANIKIGIETIDTTLKQKLKETAELQKQLDLERNSLKANLQLFGQTYLELLGQLKSSIPQTVAPGLTAKLETQQNAIKSQLKAINLNFCKFGIYSKKDSGWSERLFTISGSAPQDGIPTKGSVLIANTDINLRSGFPTYVQDKGLIFRPGIGILNEGQQITVQDIQRFELKNGDVHFWIAFIPND